MSTILYTPLDIPVSLPDPSKLYEWALANTFKETKYKQYELGWFTHSPVACCIKPTDWRDVNLLYEVEDKFKNEQVGDGVIYFQPEFSKLFPELVAAILSMPFKELTGASVKIQYGPTFAHKDDLHTIEEDGLDEPKRITMLLTKKSTLWLETTERLYPPVIDGYPIYAFNNRDCFHGSDFDESNVRMILDTAGILDARKHKELISRSVEKFKGAVLTL